MRYKTIVSNLMLIILIVSSCKKNYKDTLQSIVDNENIENVEKYEAIVIIPGSGCTGCITNAENYFLQNCDNSSTLFVLTHISSLKELKLRLSQSNLDRENVIIDKANKFYAPQYEEAIYPIFCMLRKGRIIDWKLLD